MKIAERSTFMTATQTKKMGKFARTHRNCISQTGVARPGKTAKDRAANIRARV
jgi:hypothetical protein